MLYYCVHVEVDLAKQRGMSTQAALASLAARPHSFTLDGERRTVALSQSTYQAMYYNQGPYKDYPLRTWQVFYQVYEIAEQIANPSSVPHPFARASARYARLYGLPPIS